VKKCYSGYIFNQPKTLQVLERWCHLILNGTANEIQPEFKYSDLVFSASQVNRVINGLQAKLDKEIEVNKAHWAKRGIIEVPRYDSLEGGARLALVQALFCSMHEMLEDA